jgi:ABC-2 type transport system ATP-binding protein
VTEPCLLIENISHRYGPRLALDKVSFSVETGHFCALLGPNGAGKSTLFSLATGLFTARSGRIAIAGHDMAKAPRKALASMGVVFQTPSLDADLSVLENMRYFSALHGLSGKSARLAIDEALDRLDMRERLTEKVGHLNGGHRRRMEIARALLHRPTILLLDEPTSGLDVSMRRSITDHVHRLVRHDRLTVLWATHLVDEIEPQDDLVMLNRGHIVASGPVADVTRDMPVVDIFTRLTAAPGGGDP